MELNGVKFYFLDNEFYFSGSKPFGEIYQDIEKFAFFDKAALSTLPVIDFRPDIIHCHDWQTGLIPVYLHDAFQQSEFYRGIQSIMTIHNLKFQGVWDKKTVMDTAGLDAYYFTPDKLEAFGDANYLKGGLVYADQITTVSNTYAEEIKTPFYGEKLDGLINAATHLIETEGFSNLTVTGIMRQAEIEPVQFYNRYDDLNRFIDEYVKKYDYWFSDIVKSQKQSSNDKELYINILIGLFQSLSGNKVMQELLKWELASNNETSQRTAQLRELHTLPLCQKFSNIFSNTDIDIVTISALIIGGIYYLILHDKLSTFSGIDLKKESDKQKVIKAISKLSDILFTFIPSSITKENIDIIIKMREDNIPVEKIAYYTGIPKEIIVSI